jgi:AhpD family alkylhydroperoxidase
MTALQEVEWEDCLLEPRHDPELERAVRKRVGVVPPALPYLTPCPWLAHSVYMINLHDSKLVHASFELSDLVFLAVSQDNSCRYCYAAQRAFLRLQGYPEDRIRRLEQDFFAAELDEHDRLAIDFAKSLSRANPLPSKADLKLLREAGFGEEEIKEVAFIATYTVFANRVTTLPAIPADGVEELASRWWVRLLGPLLARRLRRGKRRGSPEFLGAEQRVGPYSYLVLALDGLPLAQVLRGLLDAAWVSPILAPRAKALVFAVVARGLGATLAEHESVRLLGDGGLDGDRIEEILSQLASPILDPIEGAVLPLARESIRYRPSHIQRRAREVRQKLSVEQFVELVGITALANMVCRMETICGPS